MYKILDLFAGTQSVRKALNDLFEIDYWDLRNGVLYGQIERTDFSDVWLEDVVAYIGIDIDSPEEYNTILNLNQDDIVKKLVDKLPKDWKPDFIWASPVCNKFSAATTGPKGNTYFVVENNEIRIRRAHEYLQVKHNQYNLKPENWNRYVEEAQLAMKLHKNLVEIINYYNVPFAIENPANALSKYIYKDYVRNVCEYTAYGFEYKKPTAIYSNQDLGLRKGLIHKDQRVLRFDRINKTDKWPTHWNRDISIYANRSSVPPRLILDVIVRLLKKEGGKDVQLLTW